jgi:gamma-glutamyltranspeptidase/glutathione hydrolase
VKARAGAIANDPVAEESAQDYLLSGGSATGAVLSGFFASAGAYSGVLLGPVSILVAGIGAGARSFDGRMRQPGLGTKRPRGFKTDEAIPDAARIAVPTSFVAGLVAIAYEGSQKPTSIMKNGISRAQRAGAESRAGVLKLIRSLGAGAISDTSLVRPMLRVAGLSQGGLLTPSDFGAVPDVDREAVNRKITGATWVEPPWAEEASAVDTSELGIGCAVIAVDVRGVFAALSYRRLNDGFLLEELELEAPLAATPVQRGVTRVAPGARLPAPTPIAVRRESDGTLIEVIAAPSAVAIGKAEASAPPLSLKRDPKTLDVTASRR